MTGQFADGGIRFRYPEDWTLEREDSDTGWTVSLQSPGTAFCMICLRDDMPTPEQLTEAALSTLREDYPDLEADERLENVAGQPAVGHDIRFFSLDLTNTCWTRGFYSSEGTVLLLCQCSDVELDDYEPILRAIVASIQVEE
jgi:hypothetical protein